MSKKIIYAPGVHCGGGAVLLLELLLAFEEPYILIVDSRIILPKELHFATDIKFVKNSLIHRLIAEINLCCSVKTNDFIFCFSNLPPFFNPACRKSVFLQNRLLIDRQEFFWNRKCRWLKNFLLQKLFFAKISSVEVVYVQTPSMERLLESKIGKKVPVRVLPFASQSLLNLKGNNTKEEAQSFDFIYVASGDAHKNHLKLLEAWCILSADGLYPTLCLTFDEKAFAHLSCKLQLLCSTYNINIINLGVLKHPEIKRLYESCGAAIYPSTIESFGLPLIEAASSGLPILASELDFVRDIVEPVQTFDPNSSLSIARAVKRYLGFEQKPLRLFSPRDFLRVIFDKVST